MCLDDGEVGWLTVKKEIIDFAEVNITMMKIKLLFFIVLCVISLTSCDERKYFAFENVVYVNAFPAEYMLSEPTILDFGVIGIQGMEVLDDYIVLSCYDERGCLSVFNKNGTLVSKPFLNIGRGLGEILYQPFISWFDFHCNEDGQIIAGIFDFKGNYLEYDVNESIRIGYASWRCVADSLSLLSGSRYLTTSDDTFLCRRKNKEDTGYERSEMDRSGRQYSNGAMDYLNSITSSESNLLSTLFLVNEDRKIIAELASRLSVVHLYSLENDFQRTVSYGNKLEEIKEIESRQPDEMPKAYYDGKAFDDFFVGLYLGVTMGEFDEERFQQSQLHFFRWNGEPLLKISVPVRTLYFDVDVNEKQLYIVENDTEKILRYDISDVIDGIGA